MRSEAMAFDVIENDAGTVFRRTHAVPSGRWSAARAVALVLLATVPAIVAVSAPEHRGGECAFTGILMALAWLGGCLITPYWIRSTGLWTRVRRQLAIDDARDEAGERGHEPVRVIVDGRRLAAADRSPRVSLTKCVAAPLALGQSTDARASYHVNLVLPTSLVHVAAFEDKGEAMSVAKRLSAAIGGGDEDVRVDVEIAFESTARSIVIQAASFVAQVLVGVACVSWAIRSDFCDGPCRRFAVVAPVIAVHAVLAQGLACQLAAHAFGLHTFRTFRIDASPAVFARAPWLRVLAWTSTVVCVSLTAYWNGRYPEGGFDLAGPRLHVADVAGSKVVIGDALDAHGFHLVAIDVKRGSRRWSIPRPGPADGVAMSGNTGVAYGWEPPGSLVVAFDVRTGKPKWTRRTDSYVDDVRFKSGCALLHEVLRDSLMVPNFGAYDMDSGQPCGALSSPSAPSTAPNDLAGPQDPGARLAVMMDRMQQLEARAELSDELRAPTGGADVERDPRAVHASVPVDGVSYEADASEHRLVIRAVRAGQPLWRSELRLGAMDGVPMAVGDGLVLVAGAERRRDGSPRLRLLGLDATTGRTRFLVHHPGAAVGPTDIAVVEGTAVLFWAGELRGYDAQTGALRWCVGEVE